MTDLSPTSAGAAQPRRGLDAITLLAEGFREVGARWQPALVLWALGAAAHAVPRLIRTAQHVRHIGWTPADGAQMALIAAVSAVLAALALRLFLVRGPGWIRPDRGFWICAGLLAAATLGSSAITVFGLSPVIDPRAMGGEAIRATLAARELRQGEVVIAQLVLGWIYVRLMLWPIGALVGKAAVTPARSWALMRGQAAGFIIAVIILGAPDFLATAGVTIVGITILHARLPPGLSPLVVDRRRRPQPRRRPRPARHGRGHLARAGRGGGRSALGAASPSRFAGARRGHLKFWTFRPTGFTVNKTRTQAL